MKPAPTPPADEQTELLRKQVRQLKILNIWISIFGSIVLIVLGVMVVLIVQIVGFVNDTNQRIDTLRQNLDVQSRACESDNSFGSWLRESTGVCE